MKITKNILSIPPYISTNWRNVQAIHMQKNLLVVTLQEGEAVYIPNLSKEQVEKIFATHQVFLELEEKKSSGRESASYQNQSTKGAGSLFGTLFFNDQDNGLQMGLGSLENISSMLQHNPAQAHAPDLPAEILEKVAAVAKMIAPQDAHVIPKAEPHCNCMYCQLARAIGDSSFQKEEEKEEKREEVADEELQFQQWDVKQTGDQLYQVVNRLDKDEKYSVYLGQPLGCTCGRSGCEHIVAVLQS